MRALRSETPKALRPGAVGTNTIRAANCSTSAKASRSDSRPDGVLLNHGRRKVRGSASISLPRSGAIESKPNRKWDPLRPVRVRRDPPTLEEAVVAAQGLSDDIEQQVEIASGLMGVPQEEVRPVIASAPPSETARGFERSSRAMPQVVVLRRRAVR
jgi:hypothetical protein